MRWHYYLLVFCILVLSCTPSVAELIPAYSTVSVSASPEWVVANGSDTTTITTEVKSNNLPVPNLTVDFAVDDPTKGSVFPTRSTTNGNGNATTIFQSKTVSGTANVTATVHYTYGGVPGILAGSGIVKIDHDTPYSITYLSYPNEATVGNISTILVGMRDAHGNIVEDRRYTEYINFSLMVDTDESRFWNASAANFSDRRSMVPNDNNGNVSANISLGTSPGDTLILIDPPSTIADKRILITRVANGKPFSMTVKRDPSVPYVPADNTSYFTFTYIVYDEYGNGLNNKVLRLNSSRGDWGPFLITTVSGKAAVNYGPYDIPPGPFTADITAMVLENESVQNALQVEFYDPAPQEIYMTISPITLPSADVSGTASSLVTATVVDRYGKPVPGENVTFTVGTPRYDGIYTINTTPYLNTVGNTVYATQTDIEGFAYVDFYPSAFTRDFDDVNYSSSATGEVDIIGTWNGKTKNVTPVWKNYPYLSVSVLVDDPIVEVNETVNISLIVKADGWSFLPKPIDLILCTNRGSSMLGDMYWQGNSGNWEDKMVYLHNNAQYLLSFLNPTFGDRAGVVSFGVEGWNGYPPSQPGDDNVKSDDSSYISGHYYQSTLIYNDTATVDRILTQNIPSVNQTIRTLNPYGDKKNQNHVPMRNGIYTAIQEITGHGGTGHSTSRGGSIKAIILLSDSDWNDYGDPIAGWDGTKVATSLGYFEEEKDPLKFPESGRSHWTAFHNFDNDVNVTKADPRQNLAYYAAKNKILVFPIAYFKKGTSVPTALDTRFYEFATETGGVYYKADSGEALKQIFEDIGRRLREEASVNTTATLNFSKVTVNNITYTGEETFDYLYLDGISSFPASSRLRKWNSTITFYDQTENQTTDWNDDHILNFDIGTMYLGDNWQGNFTLRAKKAGIVELFGTGSTLKFNEGENITIPEVFEILQPIRYGDLPTQNLTIEEFSVSNTLHAAYQINYTGTKPVHVKLSYKREADINDPYHQFASFTHTCTEGCSSITGERVLSKWALLPGTYYFKIEAVAADTQPDEDMVLKIIESDAPRSTGVYQRIIQRVVKIKLR